MDTEISQKFLKNYSKISQKSTFCQPPIISMRTQQRGKRYIYTLIFRYPASKCQISKYLVISRYEGWSKESLSHAISSQPLGKQHATISNIKAKYVPFYMQYGGLKCLEGLQNDRKKLRGMLAYPRQTSLCKPVNKTSLF